MKMKNDLLTLKLFPYFTYLLTLKLYIHKERIANVYFIRPSFNLHI